MDESNDTLESLWENLLSQQKELIQKAFSSLDSQEQQAILAHLLIMASEPGWQPEQTASARAALQVLQNKI